jgi:hypothetical protein
MRPFRLKIAQQDFEELERLVLADMPREAGAFALAGMSEQSDSVELIIRRPVAIPKALFAVQQEFRLEVLSQAVNGLIALCEANGLGAVICHSHPQDSPYSPSDDYGEQRLVRTLRQFIPAHAPTASLLFYPGGVRGRVWLPDSNEPVSLSEIIVVGRHIKRIRVTEPLDTQEDISEIFERQVQAFGTAGQLLIGRSKVAVVGVGGTGSPTAEQLVRLGVTDLILIDPDTFEQSNITRVYGTFASALRRSWWPFRRKTSLKVELVAQHLRRINPQANVQAIPKNVVTQEAATSLLDRDVIFLCTDDHWGRAMVNQIAYQYFVPTINLGIRIDSSGGQISHAIGVIDLLRPGTPCLWCRQFLSAARIAAESTPSRDRQSLQREGYVENIDTPAPSVVSLTTAVSGMAVNIYFQLLTDFMGPMGNLHRLNYNALDGTVRRGLIPLAAQCLCQKVKGFGGLKTLPTVANLAFLTE